MQSNYDKNEVTYAGFFVRLAAYVIDSLILFVGLFIIRMLLWGLMLAGSKTVLGGNILFHYDLKDIILYLLESVYFIVLTYCTGTTIGKRMMNLRVVCADETRKPSLLCIIYRETIGKFLSGVILAVGYLMIAVDKECRGIHDMLCDTRVIYAKKIYGIQEKTAVNYAGDYDYSPVESEPAKTKESATGAYVYCETPYDKAQAKPIVETQTEVQIESQSEEKDEEKTKHISPWDAPL